MMSIEISSIREPFSQEEFPDESSSLLIHKVAKRALQDTPLESFFFQNLKRVCIVASFLGRIPFFPQMEKLAQGNKALGIFFKIIALPVYATDYIWSSKKMVDEMSAARNIRAILQKKGIPCDLQALGAILIGTLSQVPLLCLAYHYNPNQPMMVAFSSFDATMPIYSSYGLLKTITTPQDAPHALILDYKKRMDLLKRRFLNGDELGLEFILNDSLSIEEKTEALIEKLDDTEEEYLLVESPSRTQEVVVKFTGYLMTLYYLTWLGVFTFDGSKMVYDQVVFDSFMAIFAALANAFLIGSLFVDTQKMLFESFKYKKAGLKQITLFSEMIYPNISSILKICTVVFISFQAMAAIQISEEYLDKTYQVTNSVFLSLAYIIPAYVPTRQISDWMLTAFISKWGKQEDRKKLKIYEVLEKMELLMNASA